MQERSVYIQYCQWGLTWPHWQHLIHQLHRAQLWCMGDIGTAFIQVSNIVWENRAATSLSLAGKTMVQFNASFHKLISSKHHIFRTRQSARKGGGLFLLHVMRHRGMWRAGGELRVSYGAPEQNQAWGRFRKAILITLECYFDCLSCGPVMALNVFCRYTWQSMKWTMHFLHQQQSAFAVPIYVSL